MSQGFTRAAYNAYWLLVVLTCGALAVSSCGNDGAYSHISRESIERAVDEYGGPLLVPLGVPAGYRIIGTDSFPRAKAGTYKRCVQFQRIETATIGAFCTESASEDRNPYPWIPNDRVLRREEPKGFVVYIFAMESEPAILRDWANIPFTKDLNSVSWFSQPVES